MAASKFLILLIVFLFGSQVSAESCPDRPAYKKRQTIVIQLDKLLGHEKDPARRADLLFRMAPDALVLLGDFYFNQANMPMAKKAYEQATEYENSSIADYAVYKLAWIHINLQEFEKAGQLFVKIIVKHKSDHKNALRKEALDDYVLAYSHFGRAEQAHVLFQNIEADRCRHMLERLSGLYIEHGKFPDAITILRHLINTETNRVKIIEYQTRIIEMFSRLGMRNDILLEVKQLAQSLHLASRSKKMRRKTYRTKYAEARHAAANRMANLAATWAKESKHAPPLLAEQAEEMLAKYLEIFPDADLAYVTRVAYADFLYKNRRKYGLAAKEYEKIIETDLEKHPRGRYLCWATYGAVLARQNLLLKEKVQADLDFIEAAETHLALCPKEKNVCQVRSALAHSLTSLHHFSQAREQLTKVETNCHDSNKSTARLQIEKIDTQLKDFTGIRFKPVEIDGKLSRALIRGVMYRGRAALSDCFSKEPFEHSKPNSWVLIGFSIATNGYVAISKIVESNLANKKTKRCLEMQIRRLKFSPPPSGRYVKIVYHLEIAHHPTPQ